MKGLAQLSVELGFTQRQIMEDFTSSYLELMGDWLYEKAMTQKHGGQ